MSRPRLPHALAWLQFLFRILALLCAEGCLVTALYLSVKLHMTNPWIYVALLWSVLVNNAEIIALHSKPSDGVKRFHWCLLLVLEVIGLVLFAISAFVGFGIDIGSPAGDDMVQGRERVKRKCQIAKWFLIFAIMWVWLDAVL